jgi:S-disulfanyl-L-cysteine oxidoreductase SoxD
MEVLPTSIFKTFKWISVISVTMAFFPLYADANLGKIATQELILNMDISIAPDGQNLPSGNGGPVHGRKVYDSKCAFCHGVNGKGGDGLADALVGGIGTLTSNTPVKTVGSYWPYATTLFDYIRRAMPLNKPMTLTNDEVYGVSAYILYLNGIIADKEVMDAESLPRVVMPNRYGFVSDYD